MNRTFVPIRFVAEALGMDVKYNEITDTVEITDKIVPNTAPTGGSNTMSETTTPYRNPLMVDSSTPPETIDGLSVYTVDGVQYVAADTKKDTAGNDITGFDSKYFPNDTGYSITYVSNTFIIVTRDSNNPQTDVLSIPTDKEHVLVINGVLYIEVNYYKNTVEPLVKPVEEPTN
jgi:hypothetical protein